MLTLTNGGGTHTFIGITFTNMQGRAIQAGNTVVFNSCTFAQYNSNQNGAAFYSDQSKVYTFNSCQFLGITSTGGGVVTLNSVTSASFTNCVFANLTSTTISAGITTYFGPSITVSGCSFTDLSGGDGSALKIDWGETSVSSSTFTRCRGNTGGAINKANYNTITVVDSTFSDCGSPTATGGAIYSTTTTVVRRCSFTDFTNFVGNSNIYAILRITWDATVDNCLFARIYTTGQRAVLNHEGGSSITFSNVLIDTVTEREKCVYFAANAAVTMNNVTWRHIYQENANGCAFTLRSGSIQASNLFVEVIPD